MLIALICIYLGVWGCAYAAAHRFTGRSGFVALFAVAVVVVPAVFGGGFGLVVTRADPDYGLEWTRLTILMGVGIALIFYPLTWWRLRNRG